MNSKRIVLAVTLALAIAGVFSFVVYNYQQKQKENAAKNIKVVAATKPLPAGSPITEDSIALIDWPADMAIPGHFEDVNLVKNRVTIYPISEHQPILDRDIAQAGSGIGLTVKIPEGMRAVSVRSNDVVGVAGFLYPGSHVDVLVTTKWDNQTPLTQTVLPNVEVLTAGQRIEPDPQGKPETVNVVTLLLKPEDGEKLVLASTQGQIQFVLRNGADQNTPDTKAVSTTDLMVGVKKPVAPAAKTAARTAAPRTVGKVEKEKPPTVVYYEVETIKGTNRSVDKFQ